MPGNPSWTTGHQQDYTYREAALPERGGLFSFLLAEDGPHQDQEQPQHGHVQREYLVGQVVVHLIFGHSSSSL